MRCEEFFRDYIHTWEGGLSLDPDDAGNWVAARHGAPVLVGSRYGVTGAALARFRRCATVTPGDMAALTLDEAVRLARQLYYDEPAFDLLPWDPVVASMVDFGWGAGPRQAAMLMQRMVGAAGDGAIGPYTAAAYRQYAAHHGLEATARTWRTTRDDFYRLIVGKRPVNAKFLHGWMRRSAYFAPDGAWWRRFTAVKEAT